MNTLTPEEKKQQAKEKKRIYQREYMKKRRETDPEFAEKQRECRKNARKPDMTQTQNTGQKKVMKTKKDTQNIGRHISKVFNVKNPVK